MSSPGNYPTDLLSKLKLISDPDIKRITALNHFNVFKFVNMENNLPVCKGMYDSGANYHMSGDRNAFVKLIIVQRFL